MFEQIVLLTPGPIPLDPGRDPVQNAGSFPPVSEYLGPGGGYLAPYGKVTSSFPRARTVVGNDRNNLNM